MHALISGQAGLAVLWDDHGAWRISADAPDVMIPCVRDGLGRLFGGAVDVIALPNTSTSDAVSRLLSTWHNDRVLQLTLILLDREEEDETRSLAASCVERHIVAHRQAIEFVANRLRSTPLPAIADLSGAMRHAREVGARRLTGIIQLIANCPWKSI